LSDIFNTILSFENDSRLRMEWHAFCGCRTMLQLIVLPLNQIFPYPV
jgi:hypothetical protein